MLVSQKAVKMSLHSRLMLSDEHRSMLRVMLNREGFMTSLTDQSVYDYGGTGCKTGPEVFLHIIVVPIYFLIISQVEQTLLYWNLYRVPELLPSQNLSRLTFV